MMVINELYYKYAEIFSYTMNNNIVLNELILLTDCLINFKKEKCLQLKIFLDNYPDKVFSNIKKNFSENTLFIFKFLSHRKELFYLDKFYYAYWYLYKKANNIKELKVISNIGLSTDELKNLKKYFIEKYNVNIAIYNIIAKNIITGLKIYLDDVCYDNTMNKKLENALIKVIK